MIADVKGMGRMMRDSRDNGGWWCGGEEMVARKELVEIAQQAKMGWPCTLVHQLETSRAEAGIAQ